MRNSSSFDLALSEICVISGETFSTSGDCSSANLIFLNKSGFESLNFFGSAFLICSNASPFIGTNVLYLFQPAVTGIINLFMLFLSVGSSSLSSNSFLNLLR